MASALALGAGMLAAAPSAGAQWVIHGHGFGHGIGMSQYGAYGLAKHGRGYRAILSHYYEHTRIAKAKSRSIKVLLNSGVGSVSFSGANSACGRHLNPHNGYALAQSGSHAVLESGGGGKLAGCGRTGVAKGGGSVQIGGKGAYRGKLLARATSGGLLVINQVSLEGYVKGVIPNEMPASWSPQALRAQAVAARSYGLATSRGNPFDQYDDTRSQVYGGRSSEVKASNRAAAATAGQVLKHGHNIATAYFFSTSGGHTENIENSFIGSAPVPYLKGVKDPYDSISPLHSWKVTLSQSTMSSRLSGLFSGKLQRIAILKRGVSPRIVYARVVGSAGSSKVTGPTLRDRLGLLDSWARFCKRKCSHKGGGHHHHHHHGGHGGSGGGTGPGGGASPAELRVLSQVGPAVQPSP